MSAQPYKTWRLFDCSADAIAFRSEHGTGGWIFVIPDSDESILFPWQMTPKDIFESVFVADRNGWLIGADNKRRPDHEVRDLPKTAPLLGRIVRSSSLLGKREQARPIKRVLDANSREVVGWLYLWNTGSVSVMWKHERCKNVIYE